MRWAPRILFLGATVVGLSTASVARAQPAPTPTPSEEALAEARRLFFEGVAAQEAGQCPKALELYERARTVVSAAPLLYNIAVCRELTGALLVARATFEQAAEAARAANDEEVVRQSRRSLEKLVPKIPRIVVRLSPGSEDATATIDGAAATIDPAGIPVDPGRHHLLVRSDQHERTFDTELTVAASTTQIVNVDLRSPKGGDVAPVIVRDEGRKTFVPAIIAGGVALAFTGAAIATGVAGHDARVQYDALNAVPTADNRAEREDLRSSGQGLFAANAALIGAAVVAVSVAVYFIVSPPRRASAPPVVAGIAF